jgi:hypothetical protein
MFVILFDSLQLKMLENIMIYKLTTEQKKSVVDQNFFEKEVDGRTLTFVINTIWRSGCLTFESDGLPGLDLKNEDGLQVFATFQVIDLITENGCGHEFEFFSGFAGKEEEEVQRLFDEDGFCALEERGWRATAIKTWFYGPLVLKGMAG